MWTARIEQAAAIMRASNDPVAPWSKDNPALEVVRESARIHRVTLREILGKSHRHAVVEARRDAAIQLRSAGLSMEQIGLVLKRHHSTIAYYLEKQPRTRTSCQQRVRPIILVPDEDEMDRRASQWLAQL